MAGYYFREVRYRCITHLHVGCGQGVGAIDMPVAREQTTGYPYAPGSGIRGAIRAYYKPIAPADVVRFFGPDTGDLAAGCVSVLDAKVLLFPVRSAPGVFRWITSPFVVERYRAECKAFLGRDSAVRLPDLLPNDGEWAGTGAGDLHLDEFPFSRGGDWPDEKKPVARGVEAGRVVLVHDDAFDYFVRNATEVVTRNRLTSAKTVQSHALFSVEALPPETVLYGFLGVTADRGTTEPRLPAEDVKDKLDEKLCNSTHVILGGDESVGYGVTALEWEAWGGLRN